MIYRVILLGMLLVTKSAFGYTQIDNTLQRKQLELNERIDKSNAFLAQLSDSKQLSLRDLSILTQNIADRQTRIATIETNVETYASEFEKLCQQIDSIEQIQNALNQEYYTIVASLHKQQKLQNPILSLLSANNVQQLFRRSILADQYKAFVQAKKLEQEQAKTTIDSLYTLNMLNLETSESLRRQLEEEQTALNQRLIQQQESIGALSTQEAKIRSELAQTKQHRNTINRNIENYIQAELNSDSKPSPFSNTIVKGTLSWPTNGPIIQRFGRQQHPTLPDVFIINNGINIATFGREAIKACAAGKVIKVEVILNEGIVLVKQDDIYILYGQLSEIAINEGSQVSAGSLIGYAQEALHLGVWQGETKEDPIAWLSPK